MSAGMVSSLKTSQLWEENIFFLLTPKLKVLLCTKMLPLVSPESKEDLAQSMPLREYQFLFSFLLQFPTL